MDFKAMMRKIRFGKGLPVDEVPAPFLRRESSSRRLAALREARDVLKVLPGRGESLSCIQTGRYDLTDVLDALFDRLGAAVHLRIATLSFNARNVQRMAAWTEAGTVQRLTLLCSAFFQDHSPELFEEARQALCAPHRMAASRNHCKVVCFHFATGDKLALEGSANLRTNSNREQFSLIHDARLHDWHCAWIDEQVAKHESDKSSSAGTD
jgi:hypothetical protein